MSVLKLLGNKGVWDCSEDTEMFDQVRTCCGDDAIAALVAQPRQQAGLPGARKANAHHVIFWSGRRGSFTAQRPETLE